MATGIASLSVLNWQVFWKPATTENIQDVTDSCSSVQSAAAHPGGHQARCCGSSSHDGGSSSKNSREQICDCSMPRSDLEKTGLGEVLRWTFRAILLSTACWIHVKRANAGVYFSEGGCHTTLEGTDGADQSVQSQIHVPGFHQRPVWTHRHEEYNSRLRFSRVSPERNQLLLPRFLRGGVDAERRAILSVGTDTLRPSKPHPLTVGAELIPDQLYGLRKLPPLKDGTVAGSSSTFRWRNFKWGP